MSVTNCLPKFDRFLNSLFYFAHFELNPKFLLNHSIKIQTIKSCPCPPSVKPVSSWRANETECVEWKAYLGPLLGQWPDCGLLSARKDLSSR